MKSIVTLNPGDVLLLENQILAYGLRVGKMRKDWNLCPMEVEDALSDAIWHATAKGIVVIEAAGNGDIDLDDFTPDGNFYDWETSTGYSSGAAYWKAKRDSGAIMVAAADKATHDPGRASSNRGGRIDCYAWGEGIATIGNPDPDLDPTLPPRPPGPQDYTPGFSGTSGASAIIAGAALAIQGVAQMHRKGDLSNNRFSPRQLRNKLRNPANGTPSNMSTDKIGVMPDLKKIIEQMLCLRIIRDKRTNKPKTIRGPVPKPVRAKRKSPK
jgi:hypothetical protein